MGSNRSTGCCVPNGWRGVQLENRPEGGRLADTVEPQRGDHFALFGRETDTLEDVSLTVVGGDPFEFEQAHAIPSTRRSLPGSYPHRYASCTFGSPRIDSDLPSAISSP